VNKTNIFCTSPRQKNILVLSLRGMVAKYKLMLKLTKACNRQNTRE